MQVSILIVTYNHSLYIAKAIDSVLMQDHPFETQIVVLDDASTDNTFTLAEQQLRGVQQVTLIKNDVNLGITKNYQKGFSLCTGEYVFIVEGDDYWLDAKKISKQVAFLQEHPFHSMCFHPFIIQKGVSSIFESFSEGEQAARYLVNPTGSVSLIESYSYGINSLIKVEGLIGTFSVCCYRKKFLDLIPKQLFDITAYDWAVNLFMAHLGLIGRINSVMGVYRYAEKATWSTKTSDERSQTLEQLIPQYDKILDYKYTDLFAEKLRQIQSQVLGNIEARNDQPGFIDTVAAQLRRKLSAFVKR